MSMKKRWAAQRERSAIYMREAATALIDAYFERGRSTPYNQAEKIAALGGYYQKKRIVVCQALPLISHSFSGGHVFIGAQTWYAAIRTLGAYGLELVGSIHSHPGGLSVFMSGEDMRTHRLMFPQGVSIVLNPQRNEIQAFRCDGSRYELKFSQEEISP